MAIWTFSPQVDGTIRYPGSRTTERVKFGLEEIITTRADGPRSVFAVDLDGDGDSDVVSASFNYATIAWYKNDGTGQFGDQSVITSTARGAQSVFATDMDKDGDMDILAASGVDDTVAWYENDGDGNFGEPEIISHMIRNAIAVRAADLDGDGDPDVITASKSDNEILWFENRTDLTATNVEQNVWNVSSSRHVEIYPNPASERVFISFDDSGSATYQVEIFDLLGRRILGMKEWNQADTPEDVSIDISRLHPGVYVIRTEGNGAFWSRLLSVLRQ